MARTWKGQALTGLQIGRGVLAAALVLLLVHQATAQQQTGLFIDKAGNTGIGQEAPVAPLDVGRQKRSGTHPPRVNGLYVTGEFPAGRPAEGGTPGVEFRHSNGTQGIGFGHNAIYATGSNDDQDLNLEPRGTGKVRVNGPLEAEGAITGLGAVPVGAIMMWSGAPQNLPDGWKLCNGDNGTPDLRGRFVVGYDPNASDYKEPNSEGSRKSNQTTVTILRHRHLLGRPIDVIGTHSHTGAGLGVTTDRAKSRGKALENYDDYAGRGFGMTEWSGDDQILDIRPPYYVLAYIQYKGIHTVKQ
ncbi:hypothetical protein [Candidatus Accumulibacter sp. ACC007]|uniref:hypothetical protein n=1 Tax=Candidatus Accumulibacter sp. ACC007 TaxID=2823333 RepID=UPI0025BFF7BF|nr:hypothetical protein [Candidatus Accumulibacter sp. ACC007]